MNLKSLLVFARSKFDADVAYARLTRTAAPTFEQTLAACRAQVEGFSAEVAPDVGTPESIAVPALVGADEESSPRAGSRRRVTLRRRVAEITAEPTASSQEVEEPEPPQTS